MVRGTTGEDREMLLKDAKAVEEAGAFMVGLVLMNADIAKEISRVLKIPTSGIGAGPYCDGFSLVLYDLIGLTMGSSLPKHVKKYTNLRDIVADAVKQFIKEIKEGSFPDSEHSYK
jgi:3-methyl-2-oxobutanoate hydroxymethyltransferase